MTARDGATNGMALWLAPLRPGSSRAGRDGGVLPLTYLLGPVLGYGLLAIWSLYILQRGLASAIFALMWQRRAWARIEI